MGFRGDDRGVSAVVGFILIFGILTIGYSIYQGEVIPDQNQQIEFQHSQQVQGELSNLRDRIFLTGTTGVSQSTTITVGATYPQRSVGVNFAISGGRVQTRPAGQNGASNITFENITAVRGEVDDYWDSDNQRTSLSFPTKEIVYEPRYTRYQNAPTTIFSNSVLFNDFDRANLSISDQRLVQGTTITIVVIDGDLNVDRSGEGVTVGVDTEALSVATNTISVENNDTDRRINITVPTEVANSSDWNESSLEDQDTIHDVRTHGDSLTITLQRDRQYSLRMMKVGVGQRGTEPPAAYIVPVELPPRTVSVNTSHTAIVEVRDTFNNPENNVSVDVSASGGTFANPDQNVTAVDGQATFEYQAPSAAGDYTLEFNISRSGSPDERIVRRDVTVESTGSGGGGGGGGGGGSAANTQLVSATKTGDSDGVRFTLENTGGSGVTIQNITVDSTENKPAKQIGNGTRGAGKQNYTDGGPELRSNRSGSLLNVTTEADLVKVGDDDTRPLDTTSTISSGDRTRFTLAEFRDNANGGGKEVDPGDQVTVTIGFSDGTEKEMTLDV